MASDESLAPILLELPSLTPSLAAEILPHGLTLHRLFVQADGRTHDLVVGPEDPKGHLTQKYTNTVIGRYTNRVPVGTHTVSRNGHTSFVSPQPNSTATPLVSLHGGPVGFDAATFEAVPLDALTPSPEGTRLTTESAPGALFTKSEVETLQSRFPQGAGALFRAISKDGDQGYPGTLLVEVAVGLLQPQAPVAGAGAEGKEYHLGSVVFVYRAKLLDEGVVTPINLTQHWGFNLDASLKEGSDSTSVKGHNLTIKASHTVDIDADLLPTGTLSATASTAHAHANKPIGDRYEEISGYDHFYVFAPREPGPAAAHRIAQSAFTPALDLVQEVIAEGAADGVVELASARSGIRLKFGTNQSGVQFYSNTLATGDGAMKRIHGGSGVAGPGEGYKPASAVFLEFHEPLAAFIHPASNSSGNDTLLGPGEIYNNFVRMDVLYTSPQAL
ncbi:galactose mutarotase-like protein [Amylostereum chailletii]|nr:galactose mutarotase-like protein [Amylostereum chailletii]